jgi:CTP:phosphocholine cytidylyltransferase-like protein
MANYPADASMTTRKPDRGYSESRQFNVTNFTTQAGYEKRKLKSRRGKRNYTLTYNNISEERKDNIVNFYEARSGTFESFILDLTHLNLTGSINVRFEGELNVTHVMSGNTTEKDIFNISFNLVEAYT